MDVSTLPHSYSEYHILLVWALSVQLALQPHNQVTKDPSYTSRLLDLSIPVLCDSHSSARVCRAVTLGLEHMVLSFSLSPKERSSLTNLAAGRWRL